jgi:HEAT repeat protein
VRSDVARHARASRHDEPASERIVVRELSPASKDYASHLPRRDLARRRAFLAALRRSQNVGAEAEEVQEYREIILHDRDPEERADAILMLSGNEHPKAIRTFIKATHDPNANVRLAAVEALGDYAEELRPQVFSAAMKDQNADVRFEAVDIIGDMEGPQATRLLRVAMRDPDLHVRELAAMSLAYRRRRH